MSSNAEPEDGFENVRTTADFRNYTYELLGAEIAIDDHLDTGPQSWLGSALRCGERVLGNRLSVLPLEGWDCTSNGHPTAATHQRWKRFGESGAKLLWTESASVCRFQPLRFRTRLELMNPGGTSICLNRCGSCRTS